MTSSPRAVSSQKTRSINYGRIVRLGRNEALPNVQIIGSYPVDRKKIPRGLLGDELHSSSAGLGVTVLPKDIVPPGLHVIDGQPLPDLKDTEIALIHRDRLSIPARRLMEHVIKSLG
jgi:hypothetical protein